VGPHVALADGFEELVEIARLNCSATARICRPSPWTDDGLPRSAMAAVTASAASGLSGALALWSR